VTRLSRDLDTTETGTHLLALIDWKIDRHGVCIEAHRVQVPLIVREERAEVRVDDARFVQHAQADLSNRTDRPRAARAGVALLCALAT